ncbi:hypothetical protein [Rhizobacter sp. Root404]|uniref:hypothetical protein n=1 Tax=Rhizobacter sp. Root404 TaxID=1736528 RepID=UPI0006F51BB8|nr:hypothetical protein [Rhizobacter sp. Root404]KQW37771.1 hypothetical protein ASC76_06660 [Rhizobacter sp. Root404]
MKEYGKLTAEQFKGLIEVLPELRKQGTDFRAAVAAVPKAKLDELLIEDYSWGAIYELSFVEHLALVAYALNMGDYIKRVAQLPDPQQQILDDMWRDDMIDEEGIKLDKQTIIGLVFSIQRTILSIMLFQQTLSGLLQEVRERDSHDALFKAVRVDRSVVSAPTVADRIAKAEIRRDETFFRHLRSALKGPQKKHWEAYQDLRYALFALRELGFDRLSDVQLERLMVDTLRVYPSTPSARKNLRAQYQQSRRIKTI